MVFFRSSQTLISFGKKAANPQIFRRRNPGVGPFANPPLGAGPKHSREAGFVASEPQSFSGFFFRVTKPAEERLLAWGELLCLSLV